MQGMGKKRGNKEGACIERMSISNDTKQAYHVITSKQYLSVFGNKLVHI